MDLSVQNNVNPAFNAKVIKGRKFNKLGKYARETLFPQIQDRLKDVGGDEYTVKINADINHHADCHQITAKVKKKCRTLGKHCTFFSYLTPFHWKDFSSPEMYVEKCINEFVDTIKNIIEDRG